MFRVAIDVGGTFADLVAVDQTGQVCMKKIPTDLNQPAAGIVHGLTLLAEHWSLDLATFLAQTQQLIHGTTLALNALLEGKGARVALLTTEGFRDALEMRRSRLKDQWDLRAPLPPVLVPRHLRFGVAERLDYRGQELVPLNEAQLPQLAQKLQTAGVEAIAINYLFAFLNPDHEAKTGELLQQLLPQVFITTSSEIAPRIREYERASTTVLNAYLSPVMTSYLTQLEAELAQYGWHQPLHLVLNSGGLTNAKAVKTRGVQTLLSGPAGGARGGQSLSRALERPNLVIADMGGTSFDVNLIVQGEKQIVTEAEIGGYPISLPMVAIHSIGAGGGSIAQVDAAGGLSVGPLSAGSYPGPACYGHGGEQPTVTDAAVVLGLINPANFMDGALTLDAQRAATAIEEQIAGKLNLSTSEAAVAIYQIAAAKMADAIRLLTVQQGLDPRQFSLIAAGGAFSLFAAQIAQALSIPEVLVPLQAPVFCAWGMLNATRQTELTQSCLMTQKNWNFAAINTLMEQLSTKAIAEMTQLGVPPVEIEFEFIFEMKYLDQHHEIDITLPQSEINAQTETLLNQAFHQRHTELYGYQQPDKPWEVVNLRMVCREQALHPVFPTYAPRPGAQSQVRQLNLTNEAPVDYAVYQGGSLPALISGPALLEFPYTTIVVPPGFVASTQAQGYLALRKEATTIA